jgi:hypothetical protein
MGLDRTIPDLLQAERQIAESERRIIVQRANIAERQRHGQGVELRLFMLATMEESLRFMRGDREQILDERKPTD